VPANFNELQRSATKAAGRVAGLDVLRILNEPTAAALAYGYNKTSTERVAVYDLGGGTFDITILQLAGDVFEVLATAGDTFLGGDDIDTAIADHMGAQFLEQNRYDTRQDRQAYERLRAAAEWAKIQLSERPDVKLCIEELAYGDGGIALNLDYALTRQQLEHRGQPLVARRCDVCEDAMKAAGLRPTQLDNVSLVRSSTSIRIWSLRRVLRFRRKRWPFRHARLRSERSRSRKWRSPAPEVATSCPKRVSRMRSPTSATVRRFRLLR
jgi:molecular chaperone DnaK